MGKKLFKVGNIAIKMMWLVFVVASISNMIRRIQSAYRATLENDKIEKEIVVLGENNIKLEQNIRYATSSAYIEAMAREKFGLGEINDYWLILPDMSIDEKRGEVIETKNKRNWEKWLELFTNGM